MGVNMQDNFESLLKNYKEKNPKHCQNWKKIRALVNFSKTIDDFEEWKALEFIVHFFHKGFLDDEEAKFLEHVLKKYNIDYTQWCTLTPWVKNQIAARKASQNQPQQLYFWFPDYESKKISDRFKYPVYSNLERYKQIQLEAF